MNDYLKEIIVLERISDNWWKLTYNDSNRNFIWFGYTEGEVKGKFESWFRRLDLDRITNHYREWW